MGSDSIESARFEILIWDSTNNLKFLVVDSSSLNPNLSRDLEPGPKFSKTYNTVPDFKHPWFWILLNPRIFVSGAPHLWNSRMHQFKNKTRNLFLNNLQYIKFTKRQIPPSKSLPINRPAAPRCPESAPNQRGEWRRRKVPKTKELQERSLYPYYYYDYYYCG